MRIHRLIRALVLASLLLALSAASFAGVFISVGIAPPPIPVYTQPMCPGEGYMWTPGYWAWGDDGYYWVPGTWVMAPEPGLLWTPGYWGPHVGWYGGINYGFGYGGRGYEGGEWRGRNFYYNRSVNNVNATNITNVYNKRVVVNNNTHVSYNGGTGGVRMQPNATERQYQNEHHVEATQAQSQHFSEAAHNPQLLAKNNGGKPAIAATARPSDFKSAVPARAAGGRVAPATLNANAKNMPAPKANAAAGAGSRGGAANAGTRGGANVPKPPSATGATHGNTAATTSHNVPKPPSASERTSGRSNTAAGTHNAPAPRAETTSRNAPAAHTSAPPRSAPPQRSAPERSAPAHSAPAPHASAPQHSAPAHSAPPKEEKPKR